MYVGVWSGPDGRSGRLGCEGMHSTLPLQRSLPGGGFSIDCVRIIMPDEQTDASGEARSHQQKAAYIPEQQSGVRREKSWLHQLLGLFVIDDLQRVSTYP